jgi:hypothetical protein
MGMRSPTATVGVDVVDAGATDEELYELATRLRQELLEADVIDVRRLRDGNAPPGARAVDVQSLSSLLVTLTTSAATLQSVIGGLRRWLGKDQTRRIVLSLDGDSIEITSASDEEQRNLIDMWVRRHTDSHDD